MYKHKGASQQQTNSRMYPEAHKTHSRDHLNMLLQSNKNQAIQMRSKSKTQKHKGIHQAKPNQTHRSPIRPRIRVRNKSTLHLVDPAEPITICVNKRPPFLGYILLPHE